MRITFLTTQINLKTGGGSNISPHLKACAMQKLGHLVKMITLFPEKNSFIDKPPYSVIESSTRLKNWLMLQIKIFFVLKKYENDCDIFAFEGEHFIWGIGLYKMLRGKNPALLHFNGPIFSIYEHGATYNAKTIPKKSFRSKTSSYLRIKFEKNIGVKLANNIDFFTADSPLIKKWHEEFGFKPEKIMVLPAFVDLEPFLKETSTEYKLPKDNINLLYVGRLVPEKGIDTLLDALHEMNNNKVITYIVGHGPEKEKLVILTEKYKLDKNVIFYPWSDKKTLNDLYHCADIFVHPARWAEPLGLTVIEAMASGLPVIVPEISGSSWAAGEGGLAFKNGDVRDLKEKIEKLINDRNLRKNLAEKAKERAKEFDYRNSIGKLENILQNLIIKNKHRTF